MLLTAKQTNSRFRLCLNNASAFARIFSAGRLSLIRDPGLRFGFRQLETFLIFDIVNALPKVPEFLCDVGWLW